MTEDYSIECGRGAPGRAAWIAYASACVLLYPVGIPLLFAALLWRRRFDLCPTAKRQGLGYFFFKRASWFTEKNSHANAAEGQSAKIRSVAFLASAYSPHCCWFEVRRGGGCCCC